MLELRLAILEKPIDTMEMVSPGPLARLRTATMEFHVSRASRDEHGFDDALFALRGNVIFANFHAARVFAQKLNSKVNPLVHPERYVKAGKLNAMGLIDEILHYVAALYRERVSPSAFTALLDTFEKKLGIRKTETLLHAFVDRFPPAAVYSGKMSVEEYLKGSDGGESNRSLAIEELMMLALANANPAFGPFKRLFDDSELAVASCYLEAVELIKEHFAKLPGFGPDTQNLWDLLRSPAIAEPYSLNGQLEFLRKRWGLLIGEYLIRLLSSMDMVKEEEKPVFSGPGPTRAYVYSELEHEYERFSPDKDWMPRVVLMAKSTLVWLSQLSKKYERTIDRLDLVPDEELDEMAQRGFTGLWLIGIWERSWASKELKRRSGNPEAAASAYSLNDYDIANELGSWPGMENLKMRCAWRGIRLGSDMVPNHTGIDSRWVIEHPERFLQTKQSPFPGYTFNGDNLCSRPGVGIYLEDHYWDKSDAAVVFKRIDFSSGDTRYIFHGNDGTSMPWNDTAQIDFLNPAAREAVIATIVGVCKQFPIVRFDAAMTLAKKHIQRLWYPEPGRGGDIAGRAEHALSRAEFDKRMPNEFWREVVDRCAVEAPDTLLLAEAFWMMEGYFVRTLGMHRVYNSAFMNMLKNEENAKYRATIKNTLEFDPEILKRFVNFMNNPDEDTAVAQFGKGDKYFGVCTLMSTMPGLPMFGHGQLEGFEERYGMEYRRAYKDEIPDHQLIERHEREIFPLLKKRRLFSGSADFALYDFFVHGGVVNENIFAYSNRLGDERVLVLYNNNFERGSGWIRSSAPVAVKSPDGGKKMVVRTLSNALGLSSNEKNFTLFREQRSNLWYIRSSSQLAEQGIFVSIDGYASQIFMDLHEIEDSDTGRWRRLCDELGGRGVPDLQSAFQDLFLRDLYAAYLDLATPAYFSAVTEIVASTLGKPSDEKKKTSIGKKGPGVVVAVPKPTVVIQSFKEKVIQFAIIAEEYLDGASGRYEAFERSLPFNEMVTDIIWEEFSLSLQKLVKLAEYGITPPSGLSATGRILVERATTMLTQRPETASFLAGYLTLALLRGVVGEGANGEDAQRLIDHWCIDRKLRETYQNIGVGADEAYRIVNLMKLILSRTAPKAETEILKPAKKSIKPESVLETPKTKVEPPLLKLVRNAFASNDVRSFMGVNVFEDVEWFNKERFDEALVYTCFAAAIEAEAAVSSKPDSARKTKSERTVEKGNALQVPKLDTARWTKQLETIAHAMVAAETAEAHSGYRVDIFLTALEKALSEVVPERIEKTKTPKT